MTLFLKWFLINALTLSIAAAVGVMGINTLRGLNPVGQIIVGAVVAVYLFASTRAGTIAWKSDKDDSDPIWLKSIHDLNQVSFAANEVAYLGMLGAVSGIFFFMSSKLDPHMSAQHVQQVVGDALGGIGIAFLPTIAGIYFRISLVVQHFVINHELEAR